MDNKQNWYHIENGFQSKTAMDLAHLPIIKLAIDLLDVNPSNIFDLGCGNGVLLKKLCEADQRIIPYGVDVNPESILHAKQMLPKYSNNFRVGNIFTLDRSYFKIHFDLVIIMPGRFLEVDRQLWRELRSFLRMNTAKILVYAYDDWLTKYDGLHNLAQKAGFCLYSTEHDPVVGFAQLSYTSIGSSKPLDELKLVKKR